MQHHDQPSSPVTVRRPWIKSRRNLLATVAVVIAMRRIFTAAYALPLDRSNDRLLDTTCKRAKYGDLHSGHGE